MRSAQAKERRRPTLDGAGGAARSPGSSASQLLRGEPARGSGRVRAASAAVLHAVAPRPADLSTAAAEASGRAGLAATEAATIVARTEIPGGTLLRGARERRGLSVADVAKRTRIADRWINAIEEGRLDELPAPVFAIGYIRSYARTVGLDPGEIVERFRSCGPQRDDSFWGSLPDRSGATPRSLEQAAAKRKYFLWTATFLLLGLAALLAVWLRSRR